MKALLLSLGHGASAVLVNDGEVICGYENERLSKIKADSRFPEEAIWEVGKHTDLFYIDEIHISHWFINGKLPTIPNKYYNGLFLSRVCPQASIYHVNMEFTHHDAHLHSSKVFAGQEWCSTDKILGLVVDGFGTMGETMSMYDCSHNGHRLLHRSFGFSSSLGLLYQYATSYLGMKEHQDEYKLLGYEPKVFDYLNEEQLQYIDELVVFESNKQLRDISTYNVKHRYDPVCSIDALPALKLLYRDHFNRIFKKIGVDTETADEVLVRATVAYYVQSRLERTLEAIVKKYNPNKLLLSGGVFMNVKLNNVLINTVPGSTCIMPLCGDQGAPIGIYEARNPGAMRWPGHLLWGKRTFDASRLSQIQGDLLYFPELDQSVIQLVKSLLQEDMIVNLVRGSMEFGPRALCNTSTLAKPTQKNVEYINEVNSRSTIMPMAPVLKTELVKYVFEDEWKKVHRSLNYMICTLTYKPEEADLYVGAAHKIPNKHAYSGRPQVTDDPFLISLLDAQPDGVLINTSFNIHGCPIVYDTEDIIKSHVYQKDRDYENRIFTVVIGE